MIDTIYNLIVRTYDNYNLFLIKSSQYLCKNKLAVNYYHGKFRINYLMLYSVGVSTLLVSKYKEYTITKNLLFSFAAFTTFYMTGVHIFTSHWSNENSNYQYNDMISKDTKLLCKYNKNILDLSHILSCNVNIINELSNATAHTIKLYGYTFYSSEILQIHNDLFLKNKYVNHIYFDNHDHLKDKQKNMFYVINYTLAKSNDMFKYINNMKCKYADLIYVLLSQKYCKNKFNVSKNVLKYKIIPYILS